ncbi:HD domain-containing protein [Mesonia aquimarina]|uniref:HD domain-containing protein n=1 Tax=Mesonia aquimarina TaxID=1504967 RepID=UPI000EF5E074|nr:HD domain-containing protein [Mesonia aquimarina]
MNTEPKDILATKAFVKTELANAESGHDWFHVERVYKNALLIARQEAVDLLVVKLAALLHDIADAKFHKGDETIGPKKADNFLKTLSVSKAQQEHIIKIIRYCSFKNRNEEINFSSIEFQIIQDADRLDAMGAIGIARTFNYGGFKNRAIYNPEIQPNLNMNKEEYKHSNAPTINHFYEKLLQLKDLMNTETGKKIAEKRHQFMEDFLAQFFDEWEGKA